MLQFLLYLGQAEQLKKSWSYPTQENTKSKPVEEQVLLAVKTNKDETGKVAAFIVRHCRYDSFYMPHSAGAETVWLALIEANNQKKRKNTNHPMFPACPFLSKCWLKENLTGQRETFGNVTEKQVLTLSCVSDLAGRLWFKLWRRVGLFSSSRGPEHSQGILAGSGRHRVTVTYIRGDSEGPFHPSKPRLGRRPWHTQRFEM